MRKIHNMEREGNMLFSLFFSFLFILIIITLSNCSVFNYLTPEDWGKGGGTTDIKSGKLTYLNRKIDSLLDGATCVQVSPDNRNVYLSCTGNDAIACFDIGTSGDLTYTSSYANNSYIPQIPAFGIAPDSQFVFGLRKDTTGSVTSLERNISTGDLNYKYNTYYDGSCDFTGAKSVVVSSDNTLYVARYNDWVTALQYDVSGNITEINSYNNGSYLNGASSIALSPDEKHVYIAAKLQDGITWYTRELSGNLVNLNGILNNSSIDGANCVICSPDGRHVYVAAQDCSSIAWFSRNSTSGELTYVGKISDALLGNACACAISPDGRHVYVVAQDNDALVWYSRNADTGALAYIGDYSAPIITDPCSITISPDGNYVYVAANSSPDGIIAWFRRD